MLYPNNRKVLDMTKNKLLTLLLFPILLVGCQANESNGSPNPDNNQYKEIVQGSESPVFSDENDTWFQKRSYEVVQDNLGLTIYTQFKQVPNDELKEMIRSPISYTANELFTQDRRILRYQFENIDYYQNDGEKEIEYYDFDGVFGLNFSYSKFSGGAYSVIMDYDKNTLFFLRNESGKKVISGIYRFSDKFNLADLKFIDGFKEKFEIEKDRMYKGYKVVFADRQNTLYTIDLDSMETLSTRELGNHAIVGTVKSLKNAELFEFFVYLYDDKNKTIEKVNTSTGVVEFSTQLIQLEGNIKQIVQEGTVLYLVVEQGNMDEIYVSREDHTNYWEKVILEGYVMGSGKIDKLIYSNRNPVEEFIILFQINNNIPLSKHEFSVTDSDKSE